MVSCFWSADNTLRTLHVLCTAPKLSKASQQPQGLPDIPQLSHVCPEPFQIDLTMSFCSWSPIVALKLDHCPDPCFISNLYTIREWEKGIRSHNHTLQIKSKLTCLLDGFLQCIYPGILSNSTGQQLTSFCQYNSLLASQCLPASSKLAGHAPTASCLSETISDR